MIAAIIQARMGSTRLPGKVMLDLAGRPVLWHVVDRVRRAKLVDCVLVATTTGQEDDRIEAFCTEQGIPSFRGQADDVLKRYADAARFLKGTGKDLTHIVRITSDCPLMDPEVIDLIISRMIGGSYDYASNTLTPTFPDGLDVEVFTVQALETADQMAVLPSEREHVTPYIKKSPGFGKLNVTHDPDYSALRWTIDQPEDYRFLREVFRTLYQQGSVFLMTDLLRLLQIRPELSEYNRIIQRDEGYMRSLENDKKFKNIDETPVSSGVRLWKRAKKILPGGSQLLSKRSEQFLPERWPSYYQKAKGITVWDLDGVEYTDMSILGIGACTLGYADDEVNAAVIDAVRNGSMSTLNCPEEVELAETLLKLHPWAEMVRFGRTGGEAAAIAVRIARAFTGRDRVAFCGYHGWHDWYLAANLADDKGLDGHLLPGLSPRGVPRGLKGTALPFRYNQPEELESLFQQYPGEIGTVIMEPIRNHEPENDFLGRVRKLADENGAVLIFDEITAGWRMNVGGIHLNYGVSPDMAVFGKAMGNGHPVSAVIGRADIMDISQETFISSTNWTERVGCAAANATIEKMLRCNVPSHLISIGTYIGSEWRRLVKQHDLPFTVEEGIPPLVHLAFNHPDSLAIQTYITQEMLKSRYLARESVYVALPHTRKVVDAYIGHLEPVFDTISKALADGSVLDKLEVPLAHSGFKRLT